MITVYVVEGQYHETMEAAVADRNELLEAGYAIGPIEVYELEPEDFRYESDPNVESRASLDFEAACRYEDDAIDAQDAMEARGGPEFRKVRLFDEIPF